MSERDFGAEAHAAAAAHYEACLAAYMHEENDGYYDEYPEGDAPEYPEDMAGPFCDCETCMIREVLHAAWPILEEGAVALLVERMEAWAMVNEIAAPPLDWAGFRTALLGENAAEAAA